MADPCEWNPAEGRAAWDTEPAHADAEVMVGAGGLWRLCKGCAALPRFRRFRTRKDIERRDAHAPRA